jgi:hypothetical protein
MRVRVFPLAERASCESERGRGASLYGSGRGRGVPVGGASYESELERGRGTPSSWPRMRRTRYAIEAGCLLLWLNHFVFYYCWLWVPPYCWYRHYAYKDEKYVFPLFLLRVQVRHSLGDVIYYIMHVLFLME